MCDLPRDVRVKKPVVPWTCVTFRGSADPSYFAAMLAPFGMQKRSSLSIVAFALYLAT